MEQFKIPLRNLFFILLFFASTKLISQTKKIYIANDDHTDYMWTGDEETYKNSFIKMLDYYMDLNDKTAQNVIPYQNKWNCDGNFWLWEYEKNKTSTEFERLIKQVKDGKISVPFNALVSCYGGNPAEALLRGMYYGGSLERKYGLDLDLAVAMEDQVLPYGLPSLWAGAGAKYSWRGVCNCVTKTSGLTNRPHEIYWYKGADDNKILMKWYSIDGTNNTSLGGYAEARDPSASVDACDAKCNTTKYPYNIAGAFGKGWDDLDTYYDGFPTVAKDKTTASRQVIVSNETDFFKDFEANYGSSLPSESVSYGNEWETYCASMAEVSARVKRSVEKLRTAEALATIVARTEASFDSDLDAAKKTAWISMGLYWEHDWTGDGNVSRDKRAAWQRKIEGQISSYVDSLYNRSLKKLSSLIKSTSTKTRFFAFNPLSWTRTDICDYPYTGNTSVHVTEVKSGNEVPSQIITINGKQYIRILASNIPSLGYKVYEINSGSPAAADNAAAVSGNIIENSLYKITLTGQGVITSLIDKKNSNKECVANINGKYMNDLGSGADNSGSITIENNGPVSVTLVAGGSTPLTHTSRITVFKDISRIDINNRITQNFSDLYTWAFSYNIASPTVWHEEVGAVIKAKLTTDGGNYSPVSARYDWLTLNHFADINESSYGITLSNSDCYFMKLGNSTASTFDASTSQISVLAGGQTDGTALGIQNQGGDSDFTQRFALNTHANAFNAVNSMKFAMEHQNPLVGGQVNAGSVYPETDYCLITVSDPNVLLWSIKPAEEGISSGIVTRLWNFSNSSSSATVSFDDDITSSKEISHVETEIKSATILNGDLSASIGNNQMKSFSSKLPQKTSAVNDLANGNGKVILEKWTGISGNSISSVDFTKSPNSTADLTKIEIPGNSDVNYGVRIRGYIIPSQTGSYNLYVSSDDEGQLWLSTNDQPSNKSKIAYVSSWTNSEEWNKETNQKSSAISLIGGTKYYFEAYMKQGTGGDNLAIGWTGPGIGNITVIGGKNINSYTSTAATAAALINCGGGATGVWAADNGYIGGNAYISSSTIDVSGVNNAAPQSVYQSERYGNSTYTIPGLTIGSSYTVRLHFVEIYWNASGARVFNVNINGSRVLTNYDIFVDAGNKQNKATIKEYTATANSSGNIVIDFISVTDQAKISGIEIITGSSAARKAANVLKETGAKKINEVLVYPNPVVSGSVLTINLPSGEHTTINITDMMGKIKLQRSITNEGQYQLNTTGFAAGIYIISVSSGSSKEIIRIEIIK